MAEASAQDERTITCDDNCAAIGSRSVFGLLVGNAGSTHGGRPVLAQYQRCSAQSRRNGTRLMLSGFRLSDESVCTGELRSKAARRGQQERR